ncbi:hypothetical protein VPH35_135309 [Triticum aestivum]|uniref:Reverse transcriptase zinc-binding domain-containing protein n=1 Tax=Aegilops tauschii subsp. strangulata TaxID=200361 RepID=A0A453QRP2_AEGTS
MHNSLARSVGIFVWLGQFLGGSRRIVHDLLIFLASSLSMLCIYSGGSRRYPVVPAKAFRPCLSRQHGLVTTAGRLIPIKTVKAAKLIHHLLVTEAPAWVLGSMEKWERAFFWAGTDEINGGKCLVTWSKVVQPTCGGGLGIET